MTKSHDVLTRLALVYPRISFAGLAEVIGTTHLTCPPLIKIFFDHPREM
jgi:hypothetical protein